MANTARKLGHREPKYFTGHVSDSNDAGVTVRCDDGELDAVRAPSCLVPPGLGDEVGVLVTGDGRAFVIAVLVRSDARGIEITVKGDLRIAAEGGSCHIAATDDVQVSAERGVSLASRVLRLRAVDGSVVLSNLTVLASSVLAHTEGGRVAAKAFDWVCERLSSTVQRSYRTVGDLDQVRAARMDYRTDKEMCLRSENFLVGARKLAKLDAEQIHIG